MINSSTSRASLAVIKLFEHDVRTRTSKTSNQNSVYTGNSDMIGYFPSTTEYKLNRKLRNCIYEKNTLYLYPPSPKW